MAIRQFFSMDADTTVIITPEYALHLRPRTDILVGLEVQFSVFPILVNDYDKKDFCYVDRDHGGLPSFDPDKVLCSLNGCYTWRGCWESRIWPADVEYWGEDFVELANAFQETIKPWCEAFIKKCNPHIDE